MLTNEEKRVKIAEACGWTARQVESEDDLGPIKGHWITIYEHQNYPKHFQRQARSLPDYFNDLNAMHEAEKLFLPFDSANWQEYTYWLSHVTTLGGQDHATAAQRAEAFGLTLKLW